MQASLENIISAIIGKMLNKIGCNYEWINTISADLKKINTCMPTLGVHLKELRKAEDWVEAAINNYGELIEKTFNITKK